MSFFSFIFLLDCSFFFFFFFNDTATTEIYTLSLHDALPIYSSSQWRDHEVVEPGIRLPIRSEEHTSELQSLRHLVCRLLLEKKKTKNTPSANYKKQRKKETKLTTWTIH